jgi:hypothetical protein
MLSKHTPPWRNKIEKSVLTAGSETRIALNASIKNGQSACLGGWRMCPKAKSVLSPAVGAPDPDFRTRDLDTIASPYDDALSSYGANFPAVGLATVQP